MKKSDIIASLIIGELISWFALGILKNLDVKIIGMETRILYFVLPIAFPLLSLAAIWFAYILGKRFLIIWQAAKFILVGVLNTFVDLGVLNVLIFISGLASGGAYSLFKGISFIVASCNSYFWNKFWTFEKKETGEDPKKTEFTQFFAVSVGGFLINVGVASLVVNAVEPQFGFNPKVWANIGAIIATFLGMTWNFLGYKFIVFKK